MKMIPHHNKTVDQEFPLTSIKIHRVNEKARHPLGLKDRSATSRTRGDEIYVRAERSTIWWRLRNRWLPYYERYLNTRRRKKSVTGEQERSGALCKIWENTCRAKAPLF